MMLPYRGNGQTGIGAKCGGGLKAAKGANGGMEES